MFSSHRKGNFINANHNNDIIITSEAQLQTLIDMEYIDSSTDSLQLIDEPMDIAHSSQQSIEKSNTRNNTTAASNNRHTGKRKATETKKSPKKAKN